MPWHLCCYVTLDKLMRKNAQQDSTVATVELYAAAFKAQDFVGTNNINLLEPCPRAGDKSPRSARV